MKMSNFHSVIALGMAFPATRMPAIEFLLENKGDIAPGIAKRERGRF